MKARITVAGTLLALLAGCGNHHSLIGGHGKIGATPDSITFLASQLMGGQPWVEQDLEIENLGVGPLVVTGLTMQTTSTSEFVWQPVDPTLHFPVRLAPNQKIPIAVLYAPADLVTDTGFLVAASDDPDNPEYQIPINGPAFVPILGCTPNPVSFVEAPGVTGHRIVTCSNSGLAPVTVSGTDLDLGTSPEFTLEFTSWPVTLGPGASTSFEVDYTPADVGQDAGQILVHNDAGSDYTIGLTGEGNPTPPCPHKNDTFNALGQIDVDVLFVVDNSPSMTEEQSALHVSLPTFANYLFGHNPSVHLGVTSTDPGYGGALVGTPKFVTNTTPNAVQAFADASQVGTNGSADEEGFYAAESGLTPPTSTGANAGFLRDTAKLFLVFVSDADDSSADGAGGTPVSTYVSDFLSLKGGDATMVSASAIAAPNTTGACANAEAAGVRYQQMAQAMGGIFSTICTNDFSPALQQIGVQAQGQVFHLTAIPDPGTISVTVNGTVVPPGGWEYESFTNVVAFEPGFQPVAGDAVAIEYDLNCP